MKIIRTFMKSKKYHGLQIAVAVFEYGYHKLLTDKPEAGETVEAKVRLIKKGGDPTNPPGVNVRS